MTEVQEKHPVKPEDLFKLKALQDAKLSPDGKSVVYCVGYTEGEKREQKAGLWLLDIESGESRRLTAGVKTDTSPAWSPDGRQIAFLSSRAGMPQIYLIAVDGGEAKPITDLKQPIGGGPAWSPDGKYIAFTAGPKMETPPDPSKPYRVTRNVYRFDGIGYLDPIVQDIYVVSSEGGEPGSMSEPRSFAEPKQLTHDPMMNTGPTWSPDGQEILFNAGFDPNESYPRSELKLVDLKGQVRTVVSGTWGMGNSGTFTPDGKQIVFTGSKKDKPFGGKNDLYVIKRHGSEPECRTNALNVGVGGGLQPDFPSMVGSKTCIPKDGASAFVNVQEGGTVQIYQVALHGEESWKVILDGERSVALTGMNAEKLLFVESSLLCPPELAIADIDGNNEKRLTSLNQQILDGIQFPKVEHLLYPGADGVQIEGWYFKPSFGEAPYPTILYIHGGPTGAFGHTFNFDFHLFAGAGYGVLFINPQGSCGYGDEYSTAINPDWGNKDYRDLMAGVDYVIEKGWADGDKLGVAGLSYGGYMSCWIVGQTGRFKAAIPENPVVDWLSMYGASDISAWLCETAFGGKPHEVPEIYRKTAPITYAHKATTPTLLIQGECDYRCPAIQSEEFYTTLKANGCIVEMIRVPGGSHIMSIGGDPNWRNMQNEEMLKWFDRYVKGITVA
jgi:dipeptidyl aminopeptidase/acylaminoacyl peptidase